MSDRSQKKPLSEGAKIVLILGGGALVVLLVAVICFYSLMNRYMDQAMENDYSNQNMEDIFPDTMTTLEFKAGTYHVPEDIEIAAYYVYASEEMKFVATGADGEIDIEATISNNEEQTLSIVTEDGDAIQLIGNGTVTFVKVGEAEDYMPSDSGNEQPSHSKDGFI